MPEDQFPEPVASRYDKDEAAMFDPSVVDPAVDFLANLAGTGPALELGVGTGRIALPLAQRDITVNGIDLSAAMLDRLRAKPGAEAIGLTLGDFATARVPGEFSLVYLVFNTIMNLTSLDEQVACFQTAAAHLVPGGCFVIEVMVPQLRRLPPGQTIHPALVTPDHVCFDEYDLATQALVSHHCSRTDGTWERTSGSFRYVWPSELDLMARLAGMSLRERWGGWKREPFTSESSQHISVWERAPSSRQ